MTRSVFFWWWMLGLVLLSLPSLGQAEQGWHTEVAQKTVKGKVAQRLPRKKMRSKHRSVHNMLYPFTLRLLYTPSYRFLTKKWRDDIEESNNEKSIMEIAQFFPIATGIEGEFAFNKWVSLAVGGNFSWHDNFMTLEITDAAKEENKEGISSGFSQDYYEFAVGSSLYFNVYNYFKLGAGAELAFRNLQFNYSLTEKGKKSKIETEISWKRMSAYLALRRDFFLSKFGFGVGLNAGIPFADVFDREEEYKVYKDGEQKDIDIESDDSSREEENDDEDFYSVVLMPMIYVAF